MIAWTGIEHFVAGRFEDPPVDDEPDDMQVCSLACIWFLQNFLPSLFRFNQYALRSVQYLYWLPWAGPYVYFPLFEGRAVEHPYSICSSVEVW